jgi:hypothetical protein
MASSTGSGGHRPPSRRPRRPRTGIFHLSDFGPAGAEWQEGPPSVPDDPNELLHRVAFDCFLCGAPLNRIRDHARQDTNEDVFPRWLQRRYDLADLEIALSDGRKKKYSEVLIPACRQCNNVYMSGIEDRISRAVERGFQSFKDLPKYVVFLWCAKLYYGVVHLEVRPRDARRKVRETPSVPPHFLEDLAWVLRLLQGFRKRVLTSGHPALPFSVLRFPLQVGKDESYYFQIRHTTRFPGIAVQMGKVGVISVFDDFGLIEKGYTHNFGVAVDGHALHPVQFWEFAGRLLYVASLYPYHTQFMLVEGDRDMSIEYAPFPERERKYSERTAGTWARQMALPWTRILVGSGKGMPFYNPKTRRPITTLIKPDRSFNEMPIGDEFP